MTRFSRVDENFSQDFLSIMYAGLFPPQTSLHVSVDEAVTMFTLNIRKRARNRTGLTSALGFSGDAKRFVLQMISPVVLPALLIREET